MSAPFAITIAFIVLSAVVAAFFRKRSRDKCLKDFSNYLVTLEKTSVETILGRLKVENMGLELIYPKAREKKTGIRSRAIFSINTNFP